MSTSLRHILLTVMMLPAALMAIGITAAFIVFGIKALDDEFEARGMGIVSFLSPAAEYGVIAGNRAALDSLASAVMEQPDVSAVAVFDTELKSLVTSGRLSADKRASLSRIDSPAVIKKDTERMILVAPVFALAVSIDDFSVFNGGKTATEPIGWVWIEFDTRALEYNKQAIWVRSLVVTSILLLIMAWIAVTLATRVSASIAQLAKAVDKLRSGELDTIVDDGSRISELKTLQMGFNQMARSIADSQSTLKARVDEATAQLAHLALHDALTGLPNRRAFEEALDEAMVLSRRAGDRDALCFIDLDRFKVVNDTAGHAAGDELLRLVGQLLRAHVRASDQIYRIGGDEFVLILRACEQEEARRIAENLRQAIADLEFEWQGERFSIGASIGLARIQGDDNSAADILAAADFACYAAKKGGRNQVHESAADSNIGREKHA